MSHGILIFGSPLIRHAHKLWLSDQCYRQTIEICKSLLTDVSVIGLCRNSSIKAPGWISLDDVGVELCCELPDYGRGGIQGIDSVLKLLVSPSINKKLLRAIGFADFVYTDSTSLIGLSVSRTCRKIGIPFMYEMRGDVVFNREYMVRRFGKVGAFLAIVLKQMFSIVRSQAIAGLYINNDLMDRFPISSGFAQAIPDVQLPDELFSTPRIFEHKPKNFLYVGHLEKVKCVDLILNALHRISFSLPSDWRIDIVGNGPDETALKKLTNLLSIEDHVVFHGRIAWSNQLFNLYKKADVLLISSMTESGPRTLLEGMAAGLPVISTSVGLAPELLTKRVLVTPNDINGYAATVLGVISDHELLSQLSRENIHLSEAFRVQTLRARREAFFLKAIEITKRKKGGGSH